MDKKFVRDNTYVFTTKKYKRRMKHKGIRWDKDINGRIVDVCGPDEGAIIYKNENMCIPVKYYICPAWCKCIQVGDDK